ncbi:hypothetical protein J7I98_00275 [Streptomyces sp. ISL-98]|uniref:hypothetical protein n=1 Tax=Streptomyces sp. ISL-98 TaxID=2819192 RepID=UPI001BED32F9|nr:hypothetical protein [Streptomyces sp. ISL-98]MBT2504347.1 hypothetical protein [Streptomyces sp. ISL-98]
MAPDGLTRAVRQRLGLGRLLPLGRAADGAWLAEQAADSVLRRAAGELPGVALGALRIGLADPETVEAPAVPPPPGALPPGPLRIDADFAATADEPLPLTAEGLREVLWEVASGRLGLVITEVDLRVTDLLDAGPGGAARDSAAAAAPPEEGEAGPQAGPLAGIASAAAAAPGVGRLTSTLGAPVHVADGHVRVELATAAGHRPLEVARAVREAVAQAQGGGVTVTVVVTGVD